MDCDRLPVEIFQILQPAFILLTGPFAMYVCVFICRNTNTQQQKVAGIDGLHLELTEYFVRVIEFC